MASTASDRKADIWSKCGGRALARCPDDKLDAVQKAVVDHLVALLKPGGAEIKTKCAGTPDDNVEQLDCNYLSHHSHGGLKVLVHVRACRKEEGCQIVRASMNVNQCLQVLSSLYCIHP